MDLGPPQADRHDGEKHRLRPLARQALARPIPSDGTKEINAIYYPRNAYGGLPGVNGQAREGSTNTETGYTGASTPNGTGGFGYLRNRWYDPKTGRFLTQDPIGLTGGLNAYEYAGSNPVLFDDPFGLCQTSAGGVDHYYDVCTLEEVWSQPNNLDHDRFFLVDKYGTAREMEYTLNPVTVEATQCLWCWPQAISDREARTEDMLRTLTITGRRASFTMGGMTFDIPQARNEKAGSPEETVQMICRDATRLVRTGSGRYKFGAGGLFLGMSFHAGAWEFYTGEGASPENWAPMQVASSEAVVGYAIWTGLGCGNSKIRP